MNIIIVFMTEWAGSFRGRVTPTESDKLADSNRLKEYGGILPTSIATRYKAACDEKASRNYSMYQTLVHRKLLLSHLEFLCCCVELQDDMVWCIKQWKEMCMCIETLNSHMVTFCFPPKPTVSSARITLADVCDILVNQRAHSLSHSLIQSDPDRVLQLVKFERHLIRGILALVTGHTSLLSGIHDNVHVESVASWEECSRAIGTEWMEICCQLEGRVWQNVGRQLIAIIRMLSQDRQMAVKEMCTALSGTYM